jgi:hypothetical protein
VSRDSVKRRIAEVIDLVRAEGRVERGVARTLRESGAYPEPYLRQRDLAADHYDAAVIHLREALRALRESE